MKKLRLKSIFELSPDYKGYNFVKCSFDYNGNPNILFKKGESNKNDDDDLPELKSNIPFDYLLIIVSETVEFFHLDNIYLNFDYAFKVEENNYLFTCSHCSTDDGSDNVKNCKFFDKQKQLIKEFCIGCYFNDIQITKEGKNWVAEGDIAIFGNWDPARSGLLFFDLDGNILYELDTKDNVYDCDSLNATEESVWFYYYCDWNLVQLVDNQFRERYKPDISFIEHFSLSQQGAVQEVNFSGSLFYTPAMKISDI